MVPHSSSYVYMKWLKHHLQSKHSLSDVEGEMLPPIAPASAVTSAPEDGRAQDDAAADAHSARRRRASLPTIKVTTSGRVVSGMQCRLELPPSVGAKCHRYSSCFNLFEDA